MAITKSHARKLALSFQAVSEAPHFNRAAFRTPRKIFATLASDGADFNLMFDTALQEFYCELAPKAFAPVPGGWGRMGATRCNLKEIDEATLLSALKAAHALAAPKPKSARSLQPRANSPSSALDARQHIEQRSARAVPSSQDRTSGAAALWIGVMGSPPLGR